jgi:hypothetical protein
MPDGAIADFERAPARSPGHAPALPALVGRLLPAPSTMRGFDDRLFRVLLAGLARGVLTGMVALAGILAADVGGIGGKTVGGGHGWLPLMMMTWAFAITFGSAGMGIAIHRLGRRR